MVLHLLGGDLLAASVDDVLQPALHDEVAGGGDPDEIAGAVEAVLGEGVRVVRRGPVVPAQRVRPTGEQFAGLPGGDLPVLFVNHTDFVGR
jgi:hypothetical protein